MAGISFIYDEYKKDPIRIEKLLSGKIEISEKLDASRFSVQINKDKTFSFFKRKDSPITKIDRTLARYYEKAIYHFENLPEEKTQTIPDNWRFGMEYFPNLKPVVISYDKLPLNNLVLTDIQVKDPRDKTIEVITDKDTLNKWADNLEIQRPPIIFEGSLDEQQKRKILDFLNTRYDDLLDRFKTENFTKFIITILNPELKTAFLHNNLEKDIDGLVFRFNGKEAFRISNPDFLLSKVRKKEEKPSDIYNLTLVILQEFLTTFDIKKIKLKEKSFEDRYIELISKIFNIFVKSHYYEKNFKGNINFELPEFLTREESNSNFKFIKDEETKKLLEDSNTNRELFKILLASMRSHKKKPSGFFSKELIFNHNELVDKIADHINSNLKESLFSFEEFKSVFLGESSILQEFGKDEEDECTNLNETIISPEGSFPSFKHITKSQEYDNIKTPIEVLKKFYSSKPDSKRTKNICLMKGKFFPFHNGHLTSIRDAHKLSGDKVFLVIVSSRVNADAELHKSILDEVVINEKCVAGYEFVDGLALSDTYKKLPSDVNIKSFCGNEEECKDIMLQDSCVKVFPSVKHITSDSVFKKIEEEDLNGFKKLVPEYLHNYFYKYKNYIQKK